MMHLSHGKLSAWYHQLGQQLGAGLPLPDALRASRGAGIPSETLNAMAAAISAGGNTNDALNASAGRLPPADRVSLAASALAGRMPQTLQALSVRHAQLAAAKMKTVLACLYPAAVLHLGLLLLPIVRMIDWEKGFAWDAVAYARGLAFTLLPLWTAAIFIGVFMRRQNSVTLRLLQKLPIVGTYFRTQSLSDFSFTLGNLLEAGVPIDRAWSMAGLSSRSPQLKAAAKSMGLVIARGEQPGAALEALHCFPPEFAALYRTGEMSGQLDQNLQRLSALNQEQAQRALSLAAMVYPGLMFIAVAAGVAYFVISVYGGYLKMLTEMAG
ncbi:MAG TPA: type II secretion system F family protein [Opitutus sp.]|nr:type II secretion system F family protein [Opitutus sp.]